MQYVLSVYRIYMCVRWAQVMYCRYCVLEYLEARPSAYQRVLETFRLGGMTSILR